MSKCLLFLLPRERRSVSANAHTETKRSIARHLSHSLLAALRKVKARAEVLKQKQAQSNNAPASNSAAARTNQQAKTAPASSSPAARTNQQAKTAPASNSPAARTNQQAKTKVPAKTKDDIGVINSDRCKRCEPLIGEEVCGANGKTYVSLCHAVNCAGLRESDITASRCVEEVN